jgi:hydroxymethylglutaryl-CoA lyase
MFNLNTFQKSSYSVSKFLFLNENLAKKINERIANIRIFDVTLRDGLQTLNSTEQELFTTDYKIKLYNHLIDRYPVKNLEIGSFVNTKILPIFKDTEELFKYTENNKNHINHYILVPNQEYLLKALNLGVKNFSFITSVSNRFQFKNTKMLLNENLNHLNEMMNILDDHKRMIFNNQNNEIKLDYKVKLYVSCINECPIEGIIPLPKIISHLYCLNMLKFDKICLSDTCGTLTNEEFIKIMDSLIKTIKIDVSKISLHLHIKPERENEVQEIFHTALDYGINEFDVSELKTGGCSITMDNNKLAPNMSYEQFYKFITNYLLKNL